jgi:EmrB/QacA subfamily drug resistance transporter
MSRDTGRPGLRTARRPVAQTDAGHPQRWWILGALSLSVLAVGLDLTVLGVALPVLVAELKATTTDLQWITDSYILVLAALTLPAGSLGDRLGRKRLLAGGLAVFLAGSLLCAYARSPGSLIAFRAFMGLGGAIVMPLSLSVLPVIFGEQERPRAIAVWSVASGVSIALGPVVGGWLLDRYFWGSVFLFNVPFIAAALAAVVWLVPESRDPRARGGDPAGVLLAAAGLTSLVYGIIEQPARGWDQVTLATLTAGAALLAAFAGWEVRARHPMVNVRLFASRRFTWASIGFALVGLVLTGAMFLLTQYLQDVEGYRPFAAGLRMIPLVLGLLVGAQAASRVIPHAGAKGPMAAGLAILAAGLALFSTASVTTGYAFVAVCLTVMGTGLGAAMTPGLGAIMGAMPAGEFGAGSAVANTFRQVGGAVGVALLGGIYLDRYVAELRLPRALPAPVASIAHQSVGAADAAAARLPAPLAAQVRSAAHAAFMSGLDRTMLIAAIVAVLAAILVATLLPGRAPARQARRENMEGEPDTGSSLEPGPGFPSPGRVSRRPWSGLADRRLRRSRTRS